MHSFTIFILLSMFTPIFSTAAINCLPDTHNEYESVVKIIRKIGKNTDHCTGTLLKGGCFVLTAGHCVLCEGSENKTCTPDKFNIRKGKNSEKNIGSISEVYLHPNFVEFQKNDIALLKLSRCTDIGMEINFDHIDSTKEVIVGGYGVLKLHSSVSQFTRHMGKNKIAKLDQQKICLGEALIDSDGKTILGENRSCLPTGQDSGSPLLQKNKILGVYNSSTQIWLTNGKTKITQSCYINIQDPSIKSFIKNTLSQISRPNNKSKSQSKTQR